MPASRWDDWVADTQEWGKVAKARIEAQRKTAAEDAKLF